MRLAYAALLASLPAAAFGARVLQQSDAQPAVAPSAAAMAAAAPAPALAVRGDSGRADRFAAALSGVDAEILLGDAACTDAVASTRQATARYASGSRRYDNPEYIALSERQADVEAELAALSGEEATLRAVLQLHAEREALQAERAERFARDLRDAERSLGDASDAVSRSSARLSRARAAAESIEQHSLDRASLDQQIRGLQGAVAEAEQRLAAATEASRGQADARAVVAAAERDLAAAQASLETAQAAMKAARGSGSLTEEERTALRREARAARAAVESAEAALFTAQRAASRHDDGGARHLARRLRQLQTDLAGAQAARASLRPPGADVHELASRLPRLRSRHHDLAARLSDAQQDADRLRQRQVAQQSQCDGLGAERLAQEEVLAEMMAREESLRDELRAGEAAMASMAPTKRRTTWDELSYDIETRTRTCTVSATLLWPGGGFDQFSAQVTDTDTVHDAYAQASVAADPLDYGRTDGQRVRAADDDLLAQLRSLDAVAVDAGDTGF